jgi:SAM-dependent methyltransferase
MDAAGWNERYAGTDLVWSAGPNVFVEAICSPLAPGRALDLAAGEGRNALWLAERGWEVTAVDFSSVGLDKALRAAEARDVRLETEVADLTSYVPTSEGYDLVLIVYLHLGAAELPLIIEGAARAVAPGGRLVVVGHDVENLERGTGGPQMAEVLTTVPGVLAALEPMGLAIDRAEVAERPVIAANGSAAVALDTVVVGRRA